MTPEDQAKAIQAANDGWREANIARVISEMDRYGLTVEDIQKATLAFEQSDVIRAIDEAKAKT